MFISSEELETLLQRLCPRMLFEGPDHYNEQCKNLVLRLRVRSPHGAPPNELRSRQLWDRQVDMMSKDPNLVMGQRNPGLMFQCHADTTSVHHTTWSLSENTTMTLREDLLLLGHEILDVHDASVHLLDNYIGNSNTVCLTAMLGQCSATMANGGVLHQYRNDMHIAAGFKDNKSSKLALFHCSDLVSTSTRLTNEVKVHDDIYIAY